MRAEDLYLAFADGALSYDCPPCGRCCRGLGFGGDIARVGEVEEARAVAAFLDGEGTRGPFAMYFTYADGCRYQGDDNLCDMHREKGLAAKLRICRLFPFAKIVDLDGLWCVMPHHSCPWTARSTKEPSDLSTHASVLADLTNADGTFLRELTPTPMSAVTALDPNKRRDVEQAIRDGLDLDEPVHVALAKVADVQAERFGAPIPPPLDRELWLDLLRCAGPPPPLQRANERSFIAAIPALRVELSARLPFEALPVGLRAFELWLRALGELGQRPLSGEDLLSLLQTAAPLVHLMTLADSTLPELPEEAPRESLKEIWQELREHAGEPCGLALLEVLRPLERGALPAMMQLGTVWPR